MADNVSPTGVVDNELITITPTGKVKYSLHRTVPVSSIRGDVKSEELVLAEGEGALISHDGEYVVPLSSVTPSGD